MTPDEFKAIRKRLGLGRAAFGYALGYGGKAMNVNSLIGQLESGKKDLMPWTIRLAIMFDRFGIPEDLAPEKIDWKG